MRGKRHKGTCPECGRTFKKLTANQVFCNRGGKHTCKNRAAARRLRERAKGYWERAAEQNGAMGATVGQGN